jgi:predicted PurR-regulated permease PerM
MQIQKIEISSKTIIFAVLFILLLNFLWIVRSLIFSLFIAFIIMSALKPFVSWLASKRIPRTFSVFVVYILFLAFFVYLLTVIFPPLFVESISLFRSLPKIIDKTFPNANIFNFDSLTQYLPNLTGEAFNVVSSVFSNTLFVISTLFFGFYFLLEENIIKVLFARFIDPDKTKRVIGIINKAEKRMNAWFWGEIVLMTIVGILTFIGLNIIGMKYALPLAVLAGLFEVVPNLGPTISAIPAILIGLSTSYFMGFAVIALSFIVQQLENNLIVPMVMKKAVGLNPIITLIVLIIGGELAGVLGVLLAIPTTLFVETILIEVIAARRTA